MTGRSEFGRDWDAEELRACLGCHRPMRHRTKRAEDFAQVTVHHKGGGMCTVCREIRTKSLPGPESAEARMHLAAKAAEAVRARRQKLGITPSGRKLPRRVWSQ